MMYKIVISLTMYKFITFKSTMTMVNQFANARGNMKRNRGRFNMN